MKQFPSSLSLKSAVKSFCERLLSITREVGGRFTNGGSKNEQEAWKDRGPMIMSPREGFVIPLLDSYHPILS